MPKRLTSTDPGSSFSERPVNFRELCSRVTEIRPAVCASASRPLINNLRRRAGRIIPKRSRAPYVLYYGVAGVCVLTRTEYERVGALKNRRKKMERRTSRGRRRRERQRAGEREVRRALWFLTRLNIYSRAERAIGLRPRTHTMYTHEDDILPFNR